MTLRSILLTTLCAGTVALVPAETITEYIPDSADSVVCLNVAKLADSSITSSILEIADEPRQKLEEFAAITGIHALSDIDRVCYSRNMAQGDNSGVLVFQGRFDQKRLENLMALATKAFETTSVAGQNVNTWTEGNQQRKFQAFRPDGIAVLAFSEQAMAAALAAAADPAVSFLKKFGSDLQELTPNLDGALAWLRIPALGKTARNGAPAVMHITSFASVADIADEDLVVSATAQLDAPEHAQDLKQLAQGMLAFGRLQKEQPWLQNMANRVEIGNGPTSQSLLATASVKKSELDQLLRGASAKHNVDAQRKAAEIQRQKIEEQVQKTMEERKQQIDEQVKRNVEKAQKDIERHRARIDVEKKKLDARPEDALVKRAKLEAEKARLEAEIERLDEQQKEAQKKPGEL